MNLCGCGPRRDNMTSARIRAIRFFSRETPPEFAKTLGIDVSRMCLLETGKISASKFDVGLLLKQENVLELRGITKQQLDEREELYGL